LDELFELKNNEFGQSVSEIAEVKDRKKVGDLYMNSVIVAVNRSDFN